MFSEKWNVLSKILLVLIFFVSFVLLLKHRSPRLKENHPRKDVQYLIKQRHIIFGNGNEQQYTAKNYEHHGEQHRYRPLVRTTGIRSD